MQTPQFIPQGATKSKRNVTVLTWEKDKASCLFQVCVGLTRLFFCFFLAEKGVLGKS
jgi:hypothetical protein